MDTFSIEAMVRGTRASGMQILGNSCLVRESL